MAIPYALSIHHYISSVGSYAGFAAIIGLAVMVMLFFAQARETAWLRRRADEAEEQLQQLSAYVEQVSRQRTAAPTAAPVAAPPAAARLSQRPAAAPATAATSAAPVPSRTVAPVPAGAVALAPAAPAGVGAPALSSATRLIPLGEPDEISIRPLHPQTNGHSAEAPEAPAAPEPAEPQSPGPSTAAAGANGNGHGRGPVAAPAPAPSDAPPPAPRMPTRPGAGSRGAAAAPRRSLLDEGPRFGRGVIIGAIVAVVVVVVALGVLLSGGGSSPSHASGSASSSSQSSSSSASAGKRGTKRTTTARTTTVIPSTVTVEVLNGTATNNLAHDISTKLGSKGYKTGTPATASDQTHTQTVVGYTQPAYRVQAEAVAKSLGLSMSTVQAVSSSDRTVACSSTPTSCPDQVVVTVGSDLSSAG